MIECLLIISSVVCAFHAASLLHWYRARQSAQARMRATTVRWHRSLLLTLTDTPVRWLRRRLVRHPSVVRTEQWLAQYIQWPFAQPGSALELLLHGACWMAIGAGSATLWHAPRWLIGVAGLLGASLPWQWWWNIWSRWQRQLHSDLPAWLELLAVTVDAGLELPVAVQRLLPVMPHGPLRMVLERREQDLALGISQEVAWQRCADRAQVPLLTQLVTVLLQCQRLGTPVSHVLLDYVRQVHDEQFVAAERAGLVASQKILLPIICCIVPAYFVLTFGGFIVVWWQSGWEGIMGIFL